MIGNASTASAYPSLHAYFCALEHARTQSLVARDMALAWQLHAPDYLLITPSGVSFTRQRYLGMITSGALRYLAWEPGEMQVRHGERMAIVRYPVTLTLGNSSAPGTPMPCWHIDSYELMDGIWQAVWSQATAVRAAAAT